MRLIDCDELIERIQRNDNLPWNLDKVSQTAFISCLKKTNTAYNVDEVIKQIQDLHLRLANDTARVIHIIKNGGTV